MVKSSSRSRWLQRQQKDPYVKQARQSRYRSRAVYKLIEIDQKEKLFNRGQAVVDLGAAPGSWSQYASERVGGQGRVISVDVLPLEHIDNVLVVKGDFTQKDVFDACLSRAGRAGVDLVISDMAPNLSGIRVTDQARSMVLVEQARDFALQALKPGGDLLLKLFEGEGVTEFRRDLQEHFSKVSTRIPKASRDVSREFYVLARSYKV
jgi:23S rRNA (uridine2552-2'-O)-methyltransferase